MAKTFFKGLQVFSEPLSLILQEGVSVSAALDTQLYAQYPHDLLKGEANCCASSLCLTADAACFR